MELDVHLTREGDESWGLELIGGNDCRVPLTISQVVQSSPADAAGLQPGDSVTRVGDKLATELTQQEACVLVSEAVGSLAFGVCRGLYDPVLDDFEGIYEPERADSDLRSEPTEVSPPRCIDLPELPLTDLYDFRPITESRSLTASPFLTQTKPYRPFSTEPLQIPPLEEPIILNPKFKDEFAEILDGIDIDKVDTKYKLPVSQQYDPNYKKKVDGILEKSIEREVQVKETLETEVVESNHELNQVLEATEIINELQQVDLTRVVKELRFEENIQLEVDMVNIEQTASDVVEESIERAVSVTEEIKVAVEEELRASATRDIVEKVDLKNEEINEQKEVTTSEVLKSEETIDNIFKECKEVKIDSVAETSEKVADKPKELLYTRENKNRTKTHEVKTEMSEFVKKDYEDTASKARKESEGKQKSFNIGLQTIPNIKGMAQSSYHFDLLMRTFFIHLTDVMVAMSRFILTQPAIDLEIKAERVIKDNLITGLARETVKCDFERQEFQSSEQTDVRNNVELKREFNEEQSRHIEKHSEVKKQEYIDMELEEIERKRLSGAQMAQMTQRKPKELTHRMDAVISEFENKTGIEDRLEVTEQRARSRSRSRIEEEVMNESDPLEWLAKVDSTKSSKEVSNISTSKTHTESKISEHESTEVKTSKTSGKQMYVAVVESHVYTNKDAILSEMLETSSIESTEEMNTTDMMKIEKQQAVEVITQALEESNAIIQTELTLEASNEFNETKVNKQAVETKQELHTSVASETTEIVEDLQTKSFNILEVSEKKAVVTSEENYKATAVQSTETLFEESREEKTETKVSEKHATSKIEQLAIAVAESTDIVIDDSRVEIFEAEESKAKTAILKTEESFKTAAIEITEVALEEAVEQHAEFIQTGHATIRKTKNLAVAGIIETKTEEDKVIIPKPAEDEYAALKIIKQEVIEDEAVDVTEIIESEVVKKSIEIENYVSEEVSSYKSEKLHLKTDIACVLSQSSLNGDENNDIDTPTPSTVPPTPLTDEYVFKLQIPLPKHTGPIITEDSNDHEDLTIVKKRLVPHIETSVEETIMYDPPLPTPTEDKEPFYTKPGLNGGRRPVYFRPGLKGGASAPCQRKEYIREIERKSSLLASAIDQTIRSIEEYKEEVGIDRVEVIEEVTEAIDNEPKPEDELLGFRTVQFAPDNISLPKLSTPYIPTMPEQRTPDPYLNESGEPLGTVQGIIDGLQEATVDEEIAKELGKPGMSEDKIAELMSGESEMLREAHVMGLSRVLSSHMTKPDDSSVDFNKIKPLVESLKNSQVIAALNEEFLKSKEKSKEEKKWTTFLQKPQRPAPRAKCGYYGYLPQEENEEGPYKVKIVKQRKPKVAPDYKPEDFETGPLPWEQRALTEPAPPPVALEDPILIPEEGPEFLEAVDPLTESEVPDLQDTGIILPPPKPDVPEATIEPEETPPEVTEEVEEEIEEKKEEKKEDMKGEVEEMAEQLVQNVKGMVDPHAPIQQQLTQMRAQLAALAQLPCVIQQSLEMLTSHLASISQLETRQITESQVKTESFEEVELRVSECNVENQLSSENEVGHVTIEEIGAPELNENTIQEVPEAKITLTAEEYAALKREEEMMLEEQIKSEKLKKVQEKIDQESRQLKQRAGPRVGKPKPVFGPQNPEVRPLVLPGGRRWKGPKDVFNDQFVAETLQAQSEIIQGKVMGINFMKYEKPPVNLDHLQNSDVYKAVHGMELPQRRVDLLTPVVAEADYRERCRSMTPNTRVEEHLDIPQQLQP